MTTITSLRVYGGRYEVNVLDVSHVFSDEDVVSMLRSHNVEYATFMWIRHNLVMFQQATTITHKYWYTQQEDHIRYMIDSRSMLITELHKGERLSKVGTKLAIAKLVIVQKKDKKRLKELFDKKQKSV